MCRGEFFIVAVIAALVEWAPTAADASAAAVASAEELKSAARSRYD